MTRFQKVSLALLIALMSACVSPSRQSTPPAPQPAPGAPAPGASAAPAPVATVPSTGQASSGSQSPSPSKPRKKRAKPKPSARSSTPAQASPAVADPGARPKATSPAATDPINQLKLAWLRERSRGLLAELEAALPTTSQARVQNIPLIFDDTRGSVNAFAACADGKSLMAITDDLLRLVAYLSMIKATDERFGSNKFAEYVEFMAKHQRPKQALAKPGKDFFRADQQVDPAKLERQRQIFDETVAFILGHELAHHYLGHLPCTARPDKLGAGEIARVLSTKVPALNQPNELAADVAGTNNLLTTGTRRANGAYRYTEQGGLLTMKFFIGVQPASAADIIFGFELSHPPASLRIPVIEQAANTWRLTGGIGLPMPTLGG